MKYSLIPFVVCVMFGVMSAMAQHRPSVHYSNHAPIWIVDGVEVEAEVSADVLLLADPMAIIASAIDGVEVDDIVDYRIVKGDEAIARYGERADAGVIIVTTRNNLSTQHTMSIEGRKLYDITAPVHSREHIIARVIQMRQYNRLKEERLFLTPRLRELDRKASLLEETGIKFKPFEWSGKLSDRGNWPEIRVTIGEVRFINDHCAEVDMCYQDDDDRAFPYTLILALANGRWMIDDVRWTGFGNTLQSEEAILTYNDEFNFFTKTGTVEQIISRIKDHTYPFALEENRYNHAEKDITIMRMMQDLFRAHPQYTKELGIEVNNIITDYEAAAIAAGQLSPHPALKVVCHGIK